MSARLPQGGWFAKSWAVVPVVAVHVLVAAMLFHRQHLSLIAFPPVEVRFMPEVSPPSPPWQPPQPEIAVHFETQLSVPAPEIQVAVSASAISAKTIDFKPTAVETPGVGPKLISEVEYLRQPALRYPKLSRRLKEQGTVVLRVLVDESGHASRIDVHHSSGFPRLDAAACEAVRDAQFKPYVYEGRAQAAMVMVPIEFSLRV